MIAEENTCYGGSHLIFSSESMPLLLLQQKNINRN
jgi:hypothetical protein